MKCLQKCIGKEITAKYKLNTHHCKQQLKTFSHPTPYAKFMLHLLPYAHYDNNWHDATHCS